MKVFLKIGALCGAFLLLSSAVVYGANNSDLTQSITAGTLATDILDGSRNPVASPTAALGSKTFSFNCQSGGSASTGSLGTASERIYVMNPDAADNGWTLTIAATGGITSTWSNGGSVLFDFNDPTTSGCGDGADADTRPGQLTIDPSVTTLTTDCLTCAVTNVSKGTSTAFSQGVTDSVTLLNAANTSDDIWRGYITGAGLSQTIPAEQPVDNYTINFTITVTAT